MTWRSPAPSSQPTAVPAASGRRAARWGLPFALLWAAVASPAVVVDQTGHRIADGVARRVVALAPDVVELAFALGAGDRLVAVADAADFPPAARALSRVGTTDLEAVVRLHPDLVLATTAGNDPRLVARLGELGVRVFTVDVTSCDRLADACRRLAPLLAAEGRGATLAADIQSRCTAATRRAVRLPRRAALYIVWWDPLIVAGPGTFLDDLLRRANLVNLAPAGAGRYPQVSPELLVDARLEVAVAPDEPDVRAGFERLAARPAGRRLRDAALPVIWLPADPASRPGPRLPDALDALIAAREAAP